MAATFTTSNISVFGNMRIRTGVVTFNDGNAQIQFDGMNNVYGCIVSPESATSAGLPSVRINSSAVGTVDFASMSSGDTFNFIVMGS